MGADSSNIRQEMLVNAISAKNAEAIPQSLSCKGFQDNNKAVSRVSARPEV